MYFPTPYKDEILYSLVSRFQVWNGVKNKCDTLKFLFGSYYLTFSTDLPRRLMHFSQVSGIEAETLLYEMTLYCYYTAFMPLEIKNFAKKVMYGDNVYIKLEWNLGVWSYRINKDYIMYCPECIESDIAAYGEPYWHRIHQAPGVFICPTHACYLFNSKLPYYLYHEFLTPHKNVLIPNKREYGLSKKEFTIAYEISKEIQWIINNYDDVTKSNFKDKFYKKDIKYASRNFFDLESKFISFYGHELLDLFGQNTDDFYRYYFDEDNNVLKNILIMHFKFNYGKKYY